MEQLADSAVSPETASAVSTQSVPRNIDETKGADGSSIGAKNAQNATLAAEKVPGRSRRTLLPKTTAEATRTVSNGATRIDTNTAEKQLAASSTSSTSRPVTPTDPESDDNTEYSESTRDLQFKKKDFSRSRTQLFQSVLSSASLKSLKHQFTASAQPQLKRNPSTISQLNTKNFQSFIQAPVLLLVSNLRIDDVEIGQRLPFDQRFTSTDDYLENRPQGNSEAYSSAANGPQLKLGKADPRASAVDKKDDDYDDDNDDDDDDDDNYKEETTLQQQRLTLNALKKLSLSLAPIIRTEDDDQGPQSRQLTTKLLNSSMKKEARGGAKPTRDLRPVLRAATGLRRQKPYTPAEVDLSSFSSLTRQSRHSTDVGGGSQAVGTAQESRLPADSQARQPSRAQAQAERVSHVHNSTEHPRQSQHPQESHPQESHPQESQHPQQSPPPQPTQGNSQVQGFSLAQRLTPQEHPRLSLSALQSTSRALSHNLFSGKMASNASPETPNGLRNERPGKFEVGSASSERSINANSHNADGPAANVPAATLAPRRPGFGHHYYLSNNVGTGAGSREANEYQAGGGRHSLGALRPVQLTTTLGHRDINGRSLGQGTELAHTSSLSSVKLHGSEKRLQQINGFRSPMYVPAVLRKTVDETLDFGANAEYDGETQNNGDFGDSHGRGSSSAASVKSVDLAVSLEGVGSSGLLRTGPYELNKRQYDYILRAAPTRKHWLKDESVIECGISSCRRKFSFFERRHHCRKCGGIFCKEHTSHFLYINHLAQFTTGGRGTLSRVCDNCIQDYNDFVQHEFGVVCHRPLSRESLPQPSALKTDFRKEIFASKITGNLPMKQPEANDETKTSDQLVGSVPANWSWSSF